MLMRLLPPTALSPNNNSIRKNDIFHRPQAACSAFPLPITHFSKAGMCPLTCKEPECLQGKQLRHLPRVTLSLNAIECA